MDNGSYQMLPALRWQDVQERVSKDEYSA